MGSGISLSREQMIEIIQIQLKEEFEEKQNSKNKLNNDGYLLYENFDEEENFHIKIRNLDNLLISHYSK
jgi:hypothetical protein